MFRFAEITETYGDEWDFSDLVTRIRTDFHTDGMEIKESDISIPCTVFTSLKTVEFSLPNPLSPNLQWSTRRRPMPAVVSHGPRINHNQDRVVDHSPEDLTKRFPKLSNLIEIPKEVGKLSADEKWTLPSLSIGTRDQWKKLHEETELLKRPLVVEDVDAMDWEPTHSFPSTLLEFQQHQVNDYAMLALSSKRNLHEKVRCNVLSNLLYRI